MSVAMCAYAKNIRLLIIEILTQITERKRSRLISKLQFFNGQKILLKKV